MPLYTIRPGHSFREADGSVKSGGQTIELGEDIAELHADKVDLVDPLDAPAPAGSVDRDPVED